MHETPGFCTNGGELARIASECLTYWPRRRRLLSRCKMMAAAQPGIRIVAGQRRDPRFEPADAAPADRHRVILPGVHLDHFVVAGSLVADHSLDIDDVAAMDAHEAVLVEAGFHIADGQRTEQLVVAVEDGGVMRVGVDGDHVVDGDEMRAAVALDGKMAGEAPGRAGAAERPVAAAAHSGT